jgi:LPS sulfotransferase NodH
MMFQIKNDKVNSEYGVSKRAKSTHVELFKWLDDQPDDEKGLDKSLLILCTPRCGSTLFAEALNSSGRLGWCEEWFNYDYFDAYSQVTGNTFTLSSYTDYIAKKAIRNTGVFCLKWHIGQLVSMNEDFHLGIESMDFNHVVYLYRRDKIAQAVSLLRAVTTEQFRSYEPVNGEVKFTRTGVASALESITKFDDFTRKYLWRYIDKAYAYEDFKRLDTPQERAFEGYNDTLKALGKDKATFTVDRLKKQRDYRNRDAAEDFRKYILGELK